MHSFAAHVKKMLSERGWSGLRPSDLAKSIMIEGAELLEIFQWDNQSPEAVKADAEKMEQIRTELADVMIYCFEMGAVLDLDMEEVLSEKLKKVEEKYPVALFNTGTHGSDPGTEAIYKEVKEKYRRDGTH
ncbi:MAG: pyrophosphatase [Parcubacteria group bacterium]|nr:pyrophosphatase [Parcubacteria group bacterium]